MNKKVILLSICLLALLCLPTNVFSEGEGYTVSGIGYNYPEPDKRGNLEVHVISISLEGGFRYYYPDMNLISTSITGVTVNGDTATITGEVTVEGISGYTFVATIIDSNIDSMGLEIYNPDGNLYFSAETKKVLRGNFTISAQ